MNIIILTQAYYPDTVSVSQHLTDFSECLVESGHSVTVLTSMYGYDSDQTFEQDENRNGVKIKRIWQSKLGKKYFILRAFDFLTFNISLLFNGLFLNRKKVDLIFGTTFPPFSALIGLTLAKIKRCPFHYWMLDLQPELSIASGLIQKNSCLAKVFTLIGDYVVKCSSQIVSLDRFMTDHLIHRGAKITKIRTAPVWPVSEGEYIGSRSENPFRINSNFQNSVVVMYSGNHAHVHPLSTLLLASKRLQYDDNLHFAFVGGGVRKKDVSEFKLKNESNNISQFPFQPRSTFHISIASGDIQVVIMGDGQVGYTHPNKVYGAMYLAKPILYIGPKVSHVTDILRVISGNIMVEHGEVDLLVKKLKEFAQLEVDEIELIGITNRNYAKRHFSPETLLKKMVTFVEEKS